MICNLMPTLAAVKTPLYLKLARALEEQISRGVLRPGERIPSVRSFSRQQGVSISTVLEAFMWLEKAYEQRGPGMIGLKTQPRGDSLRSDPRYADLMKRVGFAP